MSETFEWAEGARFGALDPQVVGEALMAIRDRHGVLNAQVVLDEAGAPGSPLHDAFEWDDAAAAQAYRHEQANLLTRSLRIRVLPSSETRVRAFVRVVRDDVSQVVHAADARDDPGLRAQVIADYTKRIARLARELAAFEEFSDITAAIEQTLLRMEMAA